MLVWFRNCVSDVPNPDFHREVEEVEIILNFTYLNMLQIIHFKPVFIFTDDSKFLKKTANALWLHVTN